MTATRQLTDPNLKLNVWQHVAVFLIACAVIISRRPDAIFNAQFHCEDGAVWYANAYQFGWWRALFHARDGYFQTLPRLGASLALLVPLSRAPLVLSFLAVVVQALPVSLLLSARSSAWGILRFRACLAAVFLALPIYGEIGAIMTCAQWFLAFSAFLLVVASNPRSLVGRLFDFSILTLCGLTGPFCIVLLPIAIFIAWKRGGPRLGLPVIVLAGLSIVQMGSLLMKDPNVRSHPVLGASPTLFINLIASKIYLGTLLGYNALAIQPGIGASILLSVAFAGGTAILVVCYMKASCEMRLFILFANLLLVASLISPNTGVHAGYSTWQLLAFVEASRYWFFPMLAFAWAISWCIQNRSRVARTVSVILLCVMSFGIIREWRQPAIRDMHFADDAERFEAAPAGTVITIPEGPHEWDMTLIKH